MRYTEEKLIFGIGVSLLMVGAWMVTSKYTALASSLSTIIGGLTAVYLCRCPREQQMG